MTKISNKKLGNQFENMINRTNNFYDKKEYARITKSNEPITVTRFSKGQIRGGFFKAKSDPDYSGTMNNGQSIVFEAKHSTGTNIPFSQVKEHQERELLKHKKLGAKSFLLIGFHFERFYKINIDEWVNLKNTINKKSLNEKDLSQYSFYIKNGVLDYLGYYDE